MAAPAEILKFSEIYLILYIDAIFHGESQNLLHFCQKHFIFKVTDVLKFDNFLLS